MRYLAVIDKDSKIKGSLSKFQGFFKEIWKIFQTLSMS